MQMGAAAPSDSLGFRRPMTLPRSSISGSGICGWALRSEYPRAKASLGDLGLAEWELDCCCENVWQPQSPLALALASGLLELVTGYPDVWYRGGHGRVEYK